MKDRKKKTKKAPVLTEQRFNEIKDLLKNSKKTPRQIADWTGYSYSEVLLVNRESCWSEHCKLKQKIKEGKLMRKSMANGQPVAPAPVEEKTKSKFNEVEHLSSEINLDQIRAATWANNKALTKIEFFLSKLLGMKKVQIKGGKMRYKKVEDSLMDLLKKTTKEKTENQLELPVKN